MLYRFRDMPNHLHVGEVLGEFPPCQVCDQLTLSLHPKRYTVNTKMQTTWI
jgi:hypothetical protein